MICDLSESLRVGAERILCSFASPVRTPPREVRALEVGSRALCLTAAVYYNRRICVSKYFWTNLCDIPNSMV